MNAIKLPVSIHRSYRNDWLLRDANGMCLAMHLVRIDAEQISKALNMHDDLVAMLLQLKEAYSLNAQDKAGVIALLDRASESVNETKQTKEPNANR